MNAQKPSTTEFASARPLRKKRQDNSSFERRTLEKSISDDHIISLIETFFRTNTIGLIRRDDRVIKGWLDVNDDGEITVKFILDGPPLKPKKKGVKITVYK